jgi:hypothetical protein
MRTRTEEHATAAELTVRMPHLAGESHGWWVVREVFREL